MFKSIAIAALLIVSATAMASNVEFYTRFYNQECFVKDGVAKKVIIYGVEKDIKFTSEKKVSIEGLDKYVDLAISQTQSVPAENNVSTYKVTKNGKTVEIFSDDSFEARIIVHILAQACK